MKHWKVYGAFVLGTEAVGGLSAWLTRDGMKAVGLMPQSALTPPPMVFSLVWPVLYGLMAVGAARVALEGDCETRRMGLWYFVFQLIFNFFWSLFYFNMQAFGFSLIWLMGMWLLILGMAVNFGKCVKWTGWLQVPYLAWVAFAGYLNFVMWRLNG